MEIANKSITYFPSLPYRRFNIRLLFGWTLYYHKDAWSCDIQLYKSCRQLDLVWWRGYNTIYGRAWKAVILVIAFRNAIATKARKGVSKE